MLSYSIIKHKPVTQAHSYQHHQRTNENQRLVKTQEDLDNYLKDYPIRPGDFITWYDRTISPDSQINRLIHGTEINYVIELQTDIIKLQYDVWEVLPNIAKITSLTNAFGDARNPGYKYSTLPYIRWSNLKTYRKITDAEKEKFIDDFVLDYLKKHT